MSTKPECPFCGERDRLRIACEGMPGWTDPDYVCPACFVGTDDGPGFDDLKPANVNVDPKAAAMAFVMFGRLP